MDPLCLPTPYTETRELHCQYSTVAFTTALVMLPYSKTQATLYSMKGLLSAVCVLCVSGLGRRKVETIEKMWAVFPYHLTLSPFPSTVIPWESSLIHERNIVP